MRNHSHEVRLEAIKRWQSGEKRSVIAREMGIDYDTLLGWVKRYEAQGESGLASRYSSCGRRPKFPEDMRQRAISLRQAHSQWGSAYIRLQLQMEYPGQALPTARQIHRWLHSAGLQAVRTRLPRSTGSWVEKPFERVQVDAKERLITQDGQECCYLNFTDEHSGAVLEAVVFPLRPHQPGTTEGSI